MLQRNFFFKRLGMMLSLAALTSLSAIAQGQESGAILGRVTPAHDHDFVLATARIPDLAVKVDVAADGSFRFEGIRPGTYLVEVRVPSLGVAVGTVEVRAGEASEIELVLRPGSHSDEIVVTASAIARDPLELASPTTSLSGQDLELALESSLGETLAGEPGIHSTFFGPGASRPVIRGLTGDRVRMLEGGLGTGDASGVSADHAVATDPMSAERIEVIRGPATLLYGSSAVGGVVNVVDERIPSTRAVGGIHGSFTLRGGTGSDERTGSLNLGGGGGNFAWHVDGLTRKTGDYEIPGFVRLQGTDGAEGPFGSVPNTDLETRGARLGGTYFFGDRGFLGLSAGSFETEYGLPGGLGEGEGGGEVPVRIDLEQRRFDLKGQISAPLSGFQALRVRLGVTDYEHVELEGGDAGTQFFNDFLETRIELVQEQHGRFGGSIGLQYFDRDFEAVGAEAFLPQTTTDRWAVFTLQEIEAGPVRWQVGARFESQDTDPAGALSSLSHSGLSSSLGLVWEASDTFSIATSLARSVKLPAPEELFTDGLHVAAQAFEIGDPNLKDEVSRGLDVAFRLELEGFSGELTLFRQDFDNFFFQAFTGREEEGFPVVLYSQDDATFSGAEFKARVELVEKENHHLHLSLMGDVVNADLDAGGNLPRIPPLRLGGGLHYHSEKWNASTEVRWVDKQTDVAVNESPTDGYTLVNASLGYRILFRSQIIDLLLRGRNLTDTEARSHTSFLKNVAPLPGRNITLAVKFLF